MSTQPNAATEQPPMPSGDTFDVLPALHELLSRIDHHPVPDNAPSSGDDELTYTELAPLEPRDLPTEVLAIKAKIRRALKELEKLSDMDRSVDQQELEIKQLEQRIEKQRNMLKHMADQAHALFG